MSEKPEDPPAADGEANKDDAPAAKPEDKPAADPEEGKNADEGTNLIPKVELPAFGPADEAEEYRSFMSDDEEAEQVLEQCCCCICNCATKATHGITCCCVVPIKVGVTTIGILSVVLAAVSISNQFFLMLNDQVTWWYPVVNLVLLAPTYIGASFFMVWFGKDSVANRGRLSCGCILIIISASLLAAWAVIYFVWIYKRDTVFYGWGTPESGYVKYQKKYYIWRELAWFIAVVSAYAYFICVTSRYSAALRVARDEDSKKAYLKETADKKRANEALDKIAKEAK